MGNQARHEIKQKFKENNNYPPGACIGKIKIKFNSQLRICCGRVPWPSQLQVNNLHQIGTSDSGDDKRRRRRLQRYIYRYISTIFDSRSLAKSGGWLYRLLLVYRSKQLLPVYFCSSINTWDDVECSHSFCITRNGWQRKGASWRRTDWIASENTNSASAGVSLLIYREF